jgi:hypothetical protein
MPSNSDRDLEIDVDGVKVVGLGNFHKTLPHNSFGEVDPEEFKKLLAATAMKTNPSFGSVGGGGTNAAPFVNPRAGLSEDCLTQPPSAYEMPEAPPVLSQPTAAEMVELYWMALLRDVPFDQFSKNSDVGVAVKEIEEAFKGADGNTSAFLRPGFDVPGGRDARIPISLSNVFRIGLAGETDGPLVSQFWLRSIRFGTQTIDQRQFPYATGQNYLTNFEDWLNAQNLGRGKDGDPYSQANESSHLYFEPRERHISTMRDLARFVHKDALHQAYFNAALLMLSGGAEWTVGNPYRPKDARTPPGVISLSQREQAFGTLGGPHILALVSEVATRALRVVWYQKWQVHLRLRPEAYAGALHVQNVGVDGIKHNYGLPNLASHSEAAKRVKNTYAGSLLLPMAFTSGSPVHPAYGAGHATVAGICVTVLKAFFRTFDLDANGKAVPVPLVSKKSGDGGLMERLEPFAPRTTFRTFVPGVNEVREGTLTPIDSSGLTLEGELNKMAMNVSMGRTMGGVHWRTDNTRSLTLGEALAAQILCDIARDYDENNQGLSFRFRTFARDAANNPAIVVIDKNGIRVNGKPPVSNSRLF